MGRTLLFWCELWIVPYSIIDISKDGEEKTLSSCHPNPNVRLRCSHPACTYIQWNYLARIQLTSCKWCIWLLHNLSRPIIYVWVIGIEFKIMNTYKAIHQMWQLVINYYFVFSWKRRKKSKRILHHSLLSKIQYTWGLG